ncbi:hypothetical protein C8R45DRAFT_942294 [Mycena sanguinolenta]|nr:hypothetical protein C8R45DRAFT_942294 [Mycena sanguinolenta]
MGIHTAETGSAHIGFEMNVDPVSGNRQVESSNVFVQSAPRLIMCIIFVARAVIQQSEANTPITAIPLQPQAHCRPAPPSSLSHVDSLRRQSASSLRIALFSGETQGATVIGSNTRRDPTLFAPATQGFYAVSLLPSTAQLVFTAFDIQEDAADPNRSLLNPEDTLDVVKCEEDGSAPPGTFHLATNTLICMLGIQWMHPRPQIGPCMGDSSQCHYARTRAPAIHPRHALDGLSMSHIVPEYLEQPVVLKCR